MDSPADTLRDAKRAEFDYALDKLESESYANREGIGNKTDYQEARARVLALYDEALAEVERLQAALVSESLRDHFAAKAMQALLSSDLYSESSRANLSEIPEEAYKIADAMLMARGRK